jgi:small-conductance mechanosensitive channel
MGNELQPMFMVQLYLATGAALFGLWFLILMIAFGDWKPNYRVLAKRIGKVGIFGFVMAVTSQSQNTPAQAQQDATTRRVERLEDQATAFTATDADLKAIVSQQKDILQQLIATNAKQDERINVNTDTLQKISIAADTIQQSQDQFADRVTWVGGLLTTAVILAGFLLDRLREKRLRNGHSPFAEVFAQMEKKMGEGRKEINDLLRQLIEAQPRSPRSGTRRRTQ